ncbi:MAG: hypothetical protein QOJ12_2461 [Thermoleophilales bacterium]|jgi:hypothetical protein|nr:hypothetical protein [Thermoleophilales bacterium]
MAHCLRIARRLLVPGLSAVALLVSGASATAATGQFTLPPQVAQLFQREQAAGISLDTSVVALGDPAHPTATDVARDFGRLAWPAALLPAPSVLADPIVREWLAMVNSPDSTVVSSTQEVPQRPAPGQAPWTPGSGTGAPPLTLQSATVHPGSYRSRARAATQVGGQIIICGVSLVASHHNGVSFATGGFNCAAAVYYEDLWSWFSDFTGNLLDLPSADWNFIGELPTPSNAAGSTEANGQSAHRSVHFGITLCVPGGSCAGTTLIIANT